MDDWMRWDEAADRLEDPPRWRPEDVIYGPWAGGESRLQLLGPLAGRRVVDLGCGSGENSVALAVAGAKVTGLDISARQIARAKRLAGEYRVQVAWRHGDMHAFETWEGLQCNLILATYVLPYSPVPDVLLMHCANALEPGGTLVAALDHPLRACFWDNEMGEMAAYPLRDYHDRSSLRWYINETPVEYYHRSVGEWVDIIHAAGFSIARIVEPMPTTAMIDTYWPRDSALGSLAHIPHTLIFVARR